MRNGPLSVIWLGAVIGSMTQYSTSQIKYDGTFQVFECW